jgi:hypothetical protein
MEFTKLQSHVSSFLQKKEFKYAVWGTTLRCFLEDGTEVTFDECGPQTKKEWQETTSNIIWAIGLCDEGQEVRFESTTEAAS